jgi:hypothetical protein
LQKRGRTQTVHNLETLLCLYPYDLIIQALLQKKKKGGVEEKRTICLGIVKLMIFKSNCASDIGYK